MKQLDIVVEHEKTGAVVSLTGALSESARDELMQLMPLEADKVTFDLKGVQNIDSLGTRVWMLFFKEFSERHACTLRNVPVEMVSQIHMIPGMAFGATIESAYAPYFCGSCERPQEFLFDTNGKTSADFDEIPAKKCQYCEAIADFDADDARYFTFLDG